MRDEAAPWQPYAIEDQPAQGGTTHPHLALTLLTGGRYDAARSYGRGRATRPYAAATAATAGFGVPS